MKKQLIALAALSMPLAALGAGETYQIDPFHSYPNFSVDHVGFSTLHGRFNKMSGSFTVDAQAKTGSVELAIDAASVDTGDADKAGRPRTRDEHLRAGDFFNVTEFPRMTFKSTAVRFNGEAVSEIDGQFTMLGVTKPVTLKLERWKCGAHPFSKKAMCGGNATGTIKRTDYGMKFGVPALGDEVKVDISFEAYK